MPIYLDHHATTPCHPRVVEAMLPYFSETFGNPSSLTHEHGRRASNALEDARIAIARFFKAQPNEIYFTAGATEANNIALHQLKPGEHLITTAMEHKSVLLPAQRLAKNGVDVTILQPDAEGFISIEQVTEALRPNTRMVSIEAANGEVGTIHDIAAFGTLCRQRGILFHSDITQAAGKVPVNLQFADLASMSAHKLYGPKGVGALYVRRSVRIEPMTLGGGQERGFRSGTLNVPGAVGFATALKVRAEEMDDEALRLTQLRNVLWDRVLGVISGSRVNGPRDRRLPGNLNFSFDRIDAPALLIALRNFSLSSGSACSSGEKSASPVLLAIGVPEESAYGSIRVGLGSSNTLEHVELLATDLQRVIPKLREMSAA
jgi:cysteine desulfurase